MVLAPLHPAGDALVDGPRPQRAVRRVPGPRADTAGPERGAGTGEEALAAVRHVHGPWADPADPERGAGTGTGDDDALAAVRALAAMGLAATLDRRDRGLSRPEGPDAARWAGDRHRRLAAGLGGLPGGTWLGLDLAAVGLCESVARCRQELARILDALPVGCWLQVGVGDPALAWAAVEVVLTLTEESAPLVMTVPATLRRSAADAHLLAEAEVPIRLVEGGPAPPAVAHPWGPATDLAYARLAADLRAEGARVLLATRRPALRDALLATLGLVEVELALDAPRSPAFDPVTRHARVRVAVPCGPGWSPSWLHPLPAA